MPYDRKGYKPVKTKTVWRKGTICSCCGQEMLERHLSKTVFQRDYEVKWGVHWACQQKLLEAANRNA